jgi:hypothetical protein
MLCASVAIFFTIVMCLNFNRFNVTGEESTIS